MEPVMSVTTCVELVMKVSNVFHVNSTPTELLLLIVTVKLDIMIMMSLFVKNVHITVTPVTEMDVIPVLLDLSMLQNVTAHKKNMITVNNVNHVVVNVLIVSILPVTVLNVLKKELTLLQDVHVLVENMKLKESVKFVPTDVNSVKTKLITVTHVPLTEKTNQPVLVLTIPMMMAPMLIVQIVTTDVKPVPTKLILVKFVKTEELITHNVTVQLENMMMELPNVNLVKCNVTLVKPLLITVLNVKKTEDLPQLVIVHSVKDISKSKDKLTVHHVPNNAKLVLLNLFVLSVLKTEMELLLNVNVHSDNMLMLTMIVKNVQCHVTDVN